MTDGQDGGGLIIPVYVQLGDTSEGAIRFHAGDVEITDLSRIPVDVPRLLRAMADHIEAQQDTIPEGDTAMNRGKTVQSHDPNATIRDNQAGVSQRANRGARMTTASGPGTAPVRHRNAPKSPEGGGNASGPTRQPMSPIARPSAVSRPDPA